jgi:hypothetical protein
MGHRLDGSEVPGFYVETDTIETIVIMVPVPNGNTLEHTINVDPDFGVTEEFARAFTQAITDGLTRAGIRATVTYTSRRRWTTGAS